MVLVGLLAVGGCGGGAPSPPALRVGDVAYSAAELGALSGARRDELATLAAFGQAVAADSLGAVLHPYIERDEQSRLLQRLAADVELREAGLDEAELRRRYLQQPDYRLTVRHLVVLARPYDTDAKKAEARRKAAAALGRIRSGEPFAQVAAEVSEEPGADRSGGLLPPGREGTWVKPFWDAASKLKVGQVSDVVQSPYGFHVIKLEKREVVPFDSVRGKVVARLARDLGSQEAARQWAQRQSAGIALDTAAVGRFRTGASAPDASLARWTGGELRADELTGYLLTLDPGARARVQAATPEGFDAVVAAAARNDLLADRARAMGLDLDAATRAELAAARLDPARDWAKALGFHAGQSAAEVKQAALSALGSTAQSAAIAREQVAKLAPALQRAYPTERPAEAGEGAGS